MRSSFWLLGLAFVAGCGQSPWGSVDGENAVLLRSGPVMLTRSELETRMVEMGPEYFGYLRTRRGKRAMMDAVIEQKLLVRAAIERGLERRSGVRDDLQRLRREQEQAFRLYKENILADALMERLRENEIKVSDEEVANYYKERQKMYRVRHILLSERKKAEELLATLAKSRGRELRVFAKLAKKHSLDARTAQDGGRLPPFLEGEIDESFERAIKQMTPGQIAGPVESKLGLHLIFLEDSSIALFADEIKERCRRILERKKLEILLNQWRERYVMEVRDETLDSFIGL